MFSFCRNFHYIIFHYSCSSYNIITLSIIWLLCYIMSYHIIINLTLIIIHSITSCHFIPSLYHISYLSHYIILILYTLISYQCFISLFHIINFSSYILLHYIPYIIIIITTYLINHNLLTCDFIFIYFYINSLFSSLSLFWFIQKIWIIFFLFSGFPKKIEVFIHKFLTKLILIIMIIDQISD